jgi:hypothetical protein
MTLKEKFKQWLDTEPNVILRDTQCEIIADEFAIEFAIWLVERVAGEKGLVLQEGVLEQFKKEKGL